MAGSRGAFRDSPFTGFLQLTRRLQSEPTDARAARPVLRFLGEPEQLAGHLFELSVI
jgi:hypothetical protein